MEAKRPLYVSDWLRAFPRVDGSKAPRATVWPGLVAFLLATGIAGITAEWLAPPFGAFALLACWSVFGGLWLFRAEV